jgi:hypothetical protein
MFFRVSPEGVKPMDGLNNPNLYAIIPPPPGFTAFNPGYLV